MPDITITVTLNQAQRIAAAFGPIPPASGMTPQEWVVFNTKTYYKERVKAYEGQVSSNAAFDAARTQVDTDFGGF